MTGVERHMIMDTHLSEILKETYQKEERVRDKFIQKEDHKRRAKKMEEMKDGLEKGTFKAVEQIKEAPPPPVPSPKKLTMKEMEAKLSVELSKNLWRRSNPAYNIGSHSTLSTNVETYSYNVAEMEPLDKTHCRRRDEFTNYVEAASRYKQLMAKGGIN
mmetsp:Transcript_1594/g.2271  ORF Transcript_1594/g.2271 Transcript_1594/m.2271 type:complete len:159 (+) Transcript_1594:188-664(+)|eukprot:CAMPEP_0196570784 /NCGR_PEP_ID=MMETSP1081-20130531/957_1 /TAXON_ID=36882 /ORGANISM="Pyramimonas amylifera, Strain CCMP720" /LENGTH=158 /DNA_ID=CAMNT_0041887431 /DNA_START=108 /DNA_END=584 /DNA_ORIENTATION=-